MSLLSTQAGIPEGQDRADAAAGAALAIGAAHSAVEIANVLGLSRQAIYKALRGVPPTCQIVIRGEKLTADAWLIADLPERKRVQLTGLAERVGCRQIEDLFNAPPMPWKMPLLLHQVPKVWQERAEKLRLVMAGLLPEQHKLPPAELQERLSLEFKRVFDYEIGPRKLRALFDRAVERDCSQGNWYRIDLYVDEAAFRPLSAGPESPAGQHPHQPLDAFIGDFIRRKPVLRGQRYDLLHKIMEHYEALIAGRPKSEAAALKRSLLNYLLSAVGGISRNAKSMRRWFNENHRAWVLGGRTPEALKDGRSDNPGRKRYECPECEKTIRDLAARLRGERGKKGNVSLAIDLLLRKRELCPTCSARRSEHPPTSAERLRMTPNTIEVASVKGAEAVRAVSPTHHNTWSDTEPGDRFVIDDMTTNELTWDEVNGEIISGQAQLLYTEDEASGYSLPFWLYFGAPNSVTIKKELFLVFKSVGLPRVALVTERGVFNNRMLSGEGRARDDFGFLRLENALENYVRIAPPEAEGLERIRKRYELGLRDPALGLTITQVRSPQAKTVERSFFELQKEASLLPGFGGFNQRFEKSKHLQDFDRRVVAGKEHPGNEYLRLSDLRKNYEKILEEQAYRKIKGIRHRGRTPAQFWKEAVDRRPLTQLPPEIEAYFAARRLPAQKVHSTGIKIKLDKFTDGFYYNEHTGPLVDRHVEVHKHDDIPDFIHIMHPDSGQLLRVDRILTKRRTASPEEIAKSSAARRAHVSGARGEAGNVDNRIAGWVIRDDAYPGADKEKGRIISEDRASHKAQVQTEGRQMAEIRRIDENYGWRTPSTIPDLDLYLAGQRTKIAALNEEEGQNV